MYKEFFLELSMQKFWFHPKDGADLLTVISKNLLHCTQNYAFSLFCLFHKAKN